MLISCSTLTFTQVGLENQTFSERPGKPSAQAVSFVSRKAKGLTDL